MIVKSILLPIEKAGQIQKIANDFNCLLQELAVAANKQVKISIRGEEENLQALFELIDEASE